MEEADSSPAQRVPAMLSKYYMRVLDAVNATINVSAEGGGRACTFDS
jgi:hypothetical protein